VRDKLYIECIYIYIYIYIYSCVCICVGLRRERERERETKVEFFFMHDIKTYGRIEIERHLKISVPISINNFNFYKNRNLTLEVCDYLYALASLACVKEILVTH